MTWADFVESTFRHDIEIPRKQIPWAVFSILLAMTVTLVAGLYFGSRAADDDRTAERDAIMRDFARQLAIKDAQISTLTGQVIAMQETSLERAEQTNLTLQSILSILNDLAAGAKLNKETAQKLAAAAAKPQTRVVVMPSTAQTPSPPPRVSHRPTMALPPKDRIVPAAGDMPTGEQK